MEITKEMLLSQVERLLRAHQFRSFNFGNGKATIVGRGKIINCDVSGTTYEIDYTAAGKPVKLADMNQNVLCLATMWVNIHVNFEAIEAVPRQAPEAESPD